MKTLKQDWLIWVLIAIPIIFIIIFWKDFPAQIPTHFDLNGEPNQYSDKITGLIMLPGINILLYFLFMYLPKIDPSKNKYENFFEKLRIFRTVLHAFISFMVIITCLFSLGYSFNLSLVVMYAIAVLFLIMGNYMGNVRHNYFVGIRTPWTLSSEVVWTKTHRLAAKIWVAASAINLLLLCFVNNEQAGILFMLYLAIVISIPVLYSFFEYKKLEKSNV